VKKAHLHWLPLEGHALGNIARNRLPTAKKFLFGWKLSPSLDVFDPSHRSQIRNACGIFSSKDKPATDGDSGGYASEEDKATSAGFAIANACAGDAEACIFFPTSRCANTESATTDRRTQARLAQIHAERPEIDRFSVIKAHQNRKKWCG
jgi:hypothetical protein